ncbi:MAG: FISUMP domain-containing protein, partial [Fibrobacter sp.]|nr:FISUMP domain-containing protein [Fibrobacter sp.]
MKTFKKIGLVGAVAFALFAFNACGDDSGSTSASGENSALSSAVEDDESSSSINDDSSSSVIPGSSSSVILSDSEGSSSSVKGIAPADGASSSSVIPDPDRESSSSSVKSSSSSAKSSSSVNSSSSNKQSSSSVKSSSSSVKSSSSVASSSSSTPMSSSEYEPYNHYGDLGSIFVSKSEYKQFTDSRTGRSYYYLTINGTDKNNKPASVTVMAENLNIGEMVAGDKDQKDDSKIERYCYDNDTTNCDEYGGLYQWAEMMQLPSECNTKSCADQIEPDHQGICPNGWRLLTHDDFYIVMHANNKHGADDVRA